MNNNWIKIEGRGVTAARGYKASGVHCGLKTAKKDLALIYSEYDAVAAGVFTRNMVQGAPVQVCKSNLHNPARLIIVNSAVANACTGEKGLKNAFVMAEKGALKLGLDPGQALVCSTGIIGKQLPMKKVNSGIKMGIDNLGSGSGSDTDAAEAILTTDTTLKQVAYRANMANGAYHLAGVAKGSGMICPNMATMLAFLTTDAKIERPLLQKLFSEVVDKTFNVITIDGETSTNDTALILANGAAKGVQIKEEDASAAQFKALLEKVCRELACMIVEDGEGLTKVITLTLKGAVDDHSARVFARSVLNSSLVKASFYGRDANWGRIIAALGYAGVEFNPGLVDIYIGSCQVASNGGPSPFNKVEMKKTLRKRNVSLLIDLKQGPAYITAWGTDMSPEYVSINSDYRFKRKVKESEEQGGNERNEDRGNAAAGSAIHA